MKKSIRSVRAWLGTLGVCAALDANQAQSATLKVGDRAPSFTTLTHEGHNFDLGTRQGKWTVLYFYPKAETPGCTKQACSFRNSMDKIRAEGAEVYGISSDSVKAQAAFHAKHHLNFILLADPESTLLKLYGTKIPFISFSKRWTFVIDPELKIRAIEKDVDPAHDAEKVTKLIQKFKAESAQSQPNRIPPATAPRGNP